ncbi:MAG: diguanylate cyclase [Thermoleophilia bacterium]
MSRRLGKLSVARQPAAPIEPAVSREAHDPERAELLLHRASRLVELARELATSVEGGGPAQLVVRELRDLAEASFAACYLLGPDGKLALDAHAGDVSRPRLRTAPAVVERALARLTYARADLAELADLRARHTPCGGAVAAPLMAQGEPLGALVVATDPDHPAPLDLDLVATVADLAASSLANQRRLATTFAEARRDALTGLANQRAFHEHLDAVLREAQAAGTPLSLVLFDLDDFKLINDREGHARGDRVLRELARVAMRSLRAGEEVFRVGGEEFGIVIAAGADLAARVAERVRATVEAEARLALPTLSAGVAAFPTDARTKEELLHRADLALYAAKRAGKNRVVTYRDEEHGSRGLTRAEATLEAIGERMGRAQIRSIVLSELSGVTAAIAELGRATTERGLLETACRQIASVLGASACSISRLEGEVLRESTAHAPHPLRAASGWGVVLGAAPLARAALERGRPASATVADRAVDPEVANALGEARMASVLTLPLLLLDRPWGVVEVFDARPRDFSAAEAAIGELMVSQVAAMLAHEQHAESLRRLYRASLVSLSDALESRGGGSPGHVEDVAALAVDVAHRLGLPAEDVRLVELAALLHDVGKLRVPAELLAKPGPLTPDELALLRSHAEAGAEILAPVASLAEVLPLVRATHERWDGRGYPDGLTGGQIPLGACVVAVCEAYSAMTRAAPHRKPRSPRAAIEELRAGAGSQFEPRCVEALVELLDERAANGRTVALRRPDAA